LAIAARTTIVLLGGGESSRLPGKLALPVEGEPMLARVYRRLCSGGRPVVISVRAAPAPQTVAALPATVVYDAFPGAGPLVGLVSAAAVVKTPLMFAAAGDLPDMDDAFVAALEAEYDARSEQGQPPQAIVSAWPSGKIEPLASLYETRPFFEAGRRALLAGTLSVASAIDGLRVARRTIRAEEEVKLANVNTPADYEAYRAKAP